MKKFTKKLICFTLCVLMCMSALTSCASIPFRKAKKDADKLTEKLDDAGYEAYAVSGSLLDYLEDTLEETYGVVGAKAVVTASDAENDETGGIFFICENGIDAMKSKSGLKDYVKENPDEFEDEEERIVVRRSGKLVYVGSAKAWRAAKAPTVGGVILGIFAFTAVAVIALAIVAGAVIILIIVMKKMKAKKAAKLEAQYNVVVEAPAEAPVEAPVEAPAEE